jgi:hypothetical protein
MKGTLWIEDIVESTTTTTFIFTNYKIDMVGFVNPHKMIIRSTSLALPNARNGGESKGRDLDLQKILKPVPILKKEHQGRRRLW